MKITDYIIDRAEVEVDEGGLFDLIQKMYEPEDVFPEGELEAWARQNGYVKEDTDE
jgi:hypothetical protein